MLGNNSLGNNSLARQKKHAIHVLASTVVTLYLGLAVPPVYAGPTGGQVVGGSGSINHEDQTTNINQSSQRMAINWQTYNVNSNETVNYYQPNSNAVSLNRILDQNPSQIFGNINANGQVILINPNGMVFGQSASVNVGGLVASGLDMDPQAFMNGSMMFNAVDNTNGVVINHGLLNAATGGSISLLGQSVQNDGLITANLGRVNMASGSAAVATFDSDGLIGIEVTQDVLKNDLGIDSATLNAGTIQANGGQVLMTAKVSKDLFSNAVNNSGIVQAHSIGVHNGAIVLGGNTGDVVNSGTLDVSSDQTGVAGGTVDVTGQNITSSGTINANAQNGDGGAVTFNAEDTTLLTGASETSARSETNGIGGSVVVQGNHVGLFDQSTVDVSGANGGGQALIGGDYQGKNSDVKNATATVVTPDATIVADALENGNGGKVVVWSDGTTKYYGNISARGGAESGNGGAVEVSGKVNLNFDGNVNTSAANGAIGTLLLDPLDLHICDPTICNTNIFNPNSFDSFADSPNTNSYLSNSRLADLLAGNTSIDIYANRNISFEADVTSANLTGAATGTLLTGDLNLYAGNSISINDGVKIALDNDGLDAFDSVGSFFASINTTGSGNTASFSMGVGSSITTNGGAITIKTGNGSNSAGNINIETLDASSSFYYDVAGDINITNGGGDIVVNGSVISNSANVGAINADALGGGNITLTANNAITIQAGAKLETVGGKGGSSGSSNRGGAGGDIKFDAGTNIKIDGTLKSQGGDGGDANGTGNHGGRSGGIQLIAGTDIATSSEITANGGNAGINGGNAGRGGAITLTASRDIDISANIHAKRGTGAVTANSAGTIAISGDNNSNTFTLNNIILDSDTTAVIDGGGGSNPDTLVVKNASDKINTWTIDRTNGGTMSAYTLDTSGPSPVRVLDGSFNFRDFENLTGGDQLDEFTVQSNGWIDELIDGGNTAASASAPTIDTITINKNNTDIKLGTNVTNNSVLHVNNIESVDSLGTGNTIIGADNNVNVTNYWIIDGNNNGSVSQSNVSPPSDQNVSYSGFDYVTGGANSDNFSINAPLDGSTIISGGDGDDTFDITANLTGFTQLDGGIGNDTFKLSDGITIDTTPVNTLPSLLGGDGTDTLDLQEYNSYLAWYVDLSGATSVSGRVMDSSDIATANPIVGSFDQMENLDGSNLQDDAFYLSATMPNEVRIDPHGQQTQDILDYSGITSGTGITANLDNLTNFESVVGTQYADTLVGYNNPNYDTWSIEADGLNNLTAGCIAGSLSSYGSCATDGGIQFKDFESFTGSGQIDNFYFITAGTLAGKVKGGNGDDFFNINANITGGSMYGEAGSDTFYINASLNNTPLYGDYDPTDPAPAVPNPGNDKFIVAATDGITVIAPPGTDAIIGGDGDDELDLHLLTKELNWTINIDTTVNPATAGGDVKDAANSPIISSFDQMEIFYGSTDRKDTFVLNQSLPQNIKIFAGNSGTGNALNFGNASSISISIDSLSGFDTVTGTGGDDTLIGTDTHNWIIDGNAHGCVAAINITTCGPAEITFVSFENLVGGADVVDNFYVLAGGSVTSIDGGDTTTATAIDSLNYSLYSNPVNDIVKVDLSTTATTNATMATGVNTISNLDKFVGNSTAGNEFHAPDNTTNNWNIDSANGGDINSNTLTFSGFDKLYGGVNTDNFTVATGGNVSSIFGNDGDDVLTVVYDNTLTRSIVFNGGIEGGADNSSLDKVVLTGDAAGTAEQVTIDSATGFTSTIGSQQVTATATELLDDQVNNSSMSITGTSGIDTINVGQTASVLNVDFSGGLGITASNKTGLAIDAQGSGDSVTLQSNLNVGTNALTFMTRNFDDAGFLITAGNLTIDGANGVGSVANALQTNVDNLQLSNINGNAYINETNGLAISNSSIQGVLDLTAGGNVSSSGPISVTGTTTVDAAGFDINLSNHGNSFTGNVNIVSANNVNIANNRNLTLNNFGGNTLAAWVNGGLTVDTASNLGINDITVAGGGAVKITSNGAITDANGGARNITANTLEINAFNGIGSGDALETLVNNIRLTNGNNTSFGNGDINIDNTGNLNVGSITNYASTGGNIAITTSGSMTQSGNISVPNATANVELTATTGRLSMVEGTNTTLDNGGSIIYHAAGTVDVSTLDSKYQVGVVDITSDTGDILSTRKADLNRPNVIGDTAFFRAPYGSLGTVDRPLVIKVSGSVFIYTLNSAEPIYDGTPGQIINNSTTLFGINDARAALAGNQRTQVDALAIIDPAIFTNVKNYREDDYPVRLPADQLAEDDEDDKYKSKRKQDPDVFEQEKPYSVEDATPAQ